MLTSEKSNVRCHLFCKRCGFEFLRKFDIETFSDDLEHCTCPQCDADWTLIDAEVSKEK